MKRRVCCLLLGIYILCLPAQQVYATPVGPAAHAEERKEEKKKPHEKEHEKPKPPKPGEKPVPPHEKEHPKPHEVKKPHEEKKGPNGEEKVEPTTAPIITPTITSTPTPTAAPTVIQTTTSPSDSYLGSEVVKYALQFVGNPYKWGGTSLTTGADCSGFVQSVYAHFGCKLFRTSREQAYSAGYMDIVPTESNLKQGDLIFYANSNGAVYHVALYIGDGKVIHAANASKGIIISEYTYMKPYKARRIIE